MMMKIILEIKLVRCRCCQCQLLVQLTITGVTLLVMCRWCIYKVTSVIDSEVGSFSLFLIVNIRSFQESYCNLLNMKSKTVKCNDSVYLIFSYSLLLVIISLINFQSIFSSNYSYLDVLYNILCVDINRLEISYFFI